MTIQKLSRLALCALALVVSGCAEERKTACEAVDANSWKSYYNPKRGTLNLHYGLNPCDVQVVGEPLNGYVVIGSDTANSVRLIGDSSSSFIFHGASVNGVAVENDVLRFSADSKQFSMSSPDSEVVIKENGAKRCTNENFVCDHDGVRMGQMLFPALYPRDAALSGGLLYVADTFSHQVSIFDSTSGTLIDSIEVYYPNSVQIVGRKLIVTAEHANQVLEIDLDTKSRRILFGCGLDIYADADLTLAEVQSRQGSLIRADGRSICEGHLYSPNHATLYDDGTLLIADTDNHRVLIIRDGEIKTEIRNVNNPTTVAFWHAGKRVAQ